MKIGINKLELVDSDHHNYDSDYDFYDNEM